MNLTRREFAGAFAAAAGMAAMPVLGEGAGRQFKGWSKGHFQIHFIHSGVSESMFLIFPDSTTMLLDCGDFNAGARGELALPIMPGAEHAGEYIARYVQRVNPQRNDVDYMLISHFHRDHMGTAQWVKATVKRGNHDYPLTGFNLAAEQLNFRKAIDRTGGLFDGNELFAPSANNLPYVLGTLYSYLKARDGLEVEKFRIGATDQIVETHGGSEDFKVQNLCANGRFWRPDGTIHDSMHYRGGTAFDWNENHLSCGSIFQYGKFRFYTAGDVSGPAIDQDGEVYWPEAEFAASIMEPVTVAKVNHHGFKSMPNEMVKALRPKVYTLCTWDVLHTTAEAFFRMTHPKNKPVEGLLVVPGAFPIGRRDEVMTRNLQSRFFPEEVYNGVHTVIDVPPGGENFTLTLLDARNEDMNIVFERTIGS